MSAVESVQLTAPPKVPIWGCVKAGFRDTFGNFAAFATVAALPLCLSVAFAVTLTGLADARWNTALETVADLLPTAIFGLAWYRFLLYRSASLRPSPLPRLDRRLGAYLGYSILVMLPFGPVLILPAFPAFADSLPFHAGSVLLVALYIGAVYLWGRFSFAFPWIASDGGGRLRQSWRTTHGNGLRFLVILLLVLVPYLGLVIAVSIVAEMVAPGIIDSFGNTAVSQPGPWVTEAVYQVLNYLLYGVINAAFAQAFCHLTGWVSDNRELLACFE